MTFVDDYAHNPGKVAAVLRGQRAGGWGRIVAVFQPHRYTRTAALGHDFADAFVDADVVVTDVYAAGESPLPASPASCSSMPCSTRLPGNESCGFPTGMSWSRSWPASSVRVTCV